jgi:YVTN family beta-propeller protein
VQVDATASAADGRLSAWIDFNADGDWADAGEQVFADVPLSAGTIHTLSFAVPAAAVVGPTYARFRISTQPGLSYVGLAPDGEVEDYRIVIGNLGEIHGRKWHDLDGDGQWSPGEPFLPGWEIYLDLNDNGQWDAGEPLEATDAEGCYAFTGVPAGTYVVAEVLQPGWEQTFPAIGGDPAPAGQASPASSPSTVPSTVDFQAMPNWIGDPAFEFAGDTADPSGLQTITWMPPQPAPGGGDPLAAGSAESSSAVVSYLTVNIEPDGDRPCDLVFTPDGQSLLVVNSDTDNLVVFDAATRTVRGTVPVGDYPVNVAVSPDGRYALVSNLYGDTVSIVDLATLSVAAHVPVTGTLPYRVAVTADSAYAVVGVINDGTNSSFSVISLSTLTEVRNLASPSHSIRPDALATT